MDFFSSSCYVLVALYTDYPISAAELLPQNIILAKPSGYLLHREAARPVLSIFVGLREGNDRVASVCVVFALTLGNRREKLHREAILL